MDVKEKRACEGSNCEMEELKKRLALKDSVIESLLEANINLLMKNLFCLISFKVRHFY